MNESIEDNESGFVAHWSEMIKLDCGTIFVNPNLPDDPFFNKLTNIARSSENMLDHTIKIFSTNKMQIFVYSFNDKTLEDLLQKKNFKLYDIQHVLIKKSTQEIQTSSVRHITKKDSNLWAEIFCRSYDCPEWLDEVNKIVRNSLTDIEYLIDLEHAASCVALYEKNSILGLYCLGTLPEKRKKGFAKLLIDCALNNVKIKNLDFLMLETYQRDNLLGFYSKLGFEKLYEKKIYTL